MGRPASTKKCQACGKPGMKRNGTTSAGKVRWRCTNCNASTTRRRQDQKELATFERFLTWTSGKQTQKHFDATTTGRTLRRRISWCWNIPVPTPPVTGEIYDQVFIDGTYLAYGWCLLIARSDTGLILGWQWCHRENSAAYGALLTRLPPPLVVTTDGGSGALKAIKEHWPHTKIQRCLLHVHRNNTTDLTRNPHTMAGKTLQRLSQSLLRVSTKDQAATWVVHLANFHTHYATYLKERTYAREDPQQALSRGKTPTGWWYTHERDRRVYNRLKDLHQQDQLFTFLTAKDDTILERTTNPVESLNNKVKQVSKAHPGLSQDHLICAIEWVLYSYTENPATPRQILKNWHTNGQPTRRLIPKKPRQQTRIGPKQYDQHTTAEEGLWNRKGWAGRTQ